MHSVSCRKAHAPSWRCTPTCSTERQTQRLLKRYRQSGPLGRITRVAVAPEIACFPHHWLVGPEYHPWTLRRFWPHTGAGKLAENHGIVLGKETLRRLMIKPGSGFPASNARQKFSSHAIPSLLRRTDTDWWLRPSLVRDRAPACTALVYVDDATSRLMRFDLLNRNRLSPILKPRGATGKAWQTPSAVQR